MKSARPYMFGFWMLAIILILKLAWMIIDVIQAQNNPYIPVRRPGPVAMAVLFTLFAEAIFYYYCRYYILNKLWIRVHAWTTLGAVILIPVIIALLMPVLIHDYYANLPAETEYFHNSKSDSLLSKVMRIRGFVFWGLLAIGHIFFIATIVKSFQLKEPKTDESAGLLDEFVDRR